MSVMSVWSGVQFKSNVSLLIFCLDYFSKPEWSVEVPCNSCIAVYLSLSI